MLKFACACAQVKAAKLGHILVIDEADKAPTNVTSILKTLVESGEMILADGRRIISGTAHPKACWSRAGSKVTTSSPAERFSRGTRQLCYYPRAFQLSETCSSSLQVAFTRQ